MAATLRAPQEPRARMSAKQGWALAVLVLPVLLISIDMTVLGFAVPFLSEDLAPTGSQLLWIVDVYGFVLAGLLVTMGTLGDRFGPPQAPHHRLGRVRRRERPRRLRAERRSAHRRPGPARRRRRHPHADHAGAHAEPVPRRPPAPVRDRDLGLRVLRRARPPGRSSAAGCWSTSGGARCSSWPRRSRSPSCWPRRSCCRSRRTRTRAGSTCRASPCRSWRCSRSSTASRRSPSTA